jgi:hypothetical protein
VVSALPLYGVEPDGGGKCLVEVPQAQSAVATAMQEIVDLTLLDDGSTVEVECLCGYSPGLCPVRHVCIYLIPIQAYDQSSAG